MGKEMPTERPDTELISVQQMMDFLDKNPEESKEILGFVLSEVEDKKNLGLTGKQVVKVMEKMGYKPASADLLDKILRVDVEKSVWDDEYHVILEK